MRIFFLLVNKVMRLEVVTQEKCTKKMSREPRAELWELIFKVCKEDRAIWLKDVVILRPR